MQRQSLGSPVSKLTGHGGLGAKDDLNLPDDPKRRDLPSPSLTDYDDEHHKTTKPRRFSSPSSSSLSSSSAKPEKLVHLIPLLTVLCFLVLYLVSHDPSQSDLAQFHGLKLSSHDIAEISDAGEFTELRRGNLLAIRSLRNLQDITDKHSAPKYRSHRKIGDF